MKPDNDGLSETNDDNGKKINLTYSIERWKEIAAKCVRNMRYEIELGFWLDIIIHRSWQKYFLPLSLVYCWMFRASFRILVSNRAC